MQQQQKNMHISNLRQRGVNILKIKKKKKKFIIYLLGVCVLSNN